MLKFSEPGNPVLFGESKECSFIKLLQTKWDALHQESDIFRYKINNLEQKVLGNYFLQLNPDRSTKRRTPERIDNIVQPFDSNKFNFTKAPTREILFNLVREGNYSEMHRLLVNVSPISRYHTLLCPSINKCLPQVVTEESVHLTLDLMFLAQDCTDLRIGFNSLCAMASVNHLHYHLFLENNALPVETAKCKQIKGALYCLEEYPVPAFCFEVQPHTITEASKDIYKLLAYFLKSSIAHNLFISRGQRLKVQAVQSSADKGELGGKEGQSDEDEEDEDELGSKEVVRVLVWPRRSSAGAKQLSSFNVAVCELSGWFPIYYKQDYDHLTKEDLENELRKWLIDNFEQLCEEIKCLF